MGYDERENTRNIISWFDKHKPVMNAFINGREIQFLDKDNVWQQSSTPTWGSSTSYRIKSKVITFDPFIGKRVMHKKTGFQDIIITTVIFEMSAVLNLYSTTQVDKNYRTIEALKKDFYIEGEEE